MLSGSKLKICVLLLLVMVSNLSANPIRYDFLTDGRKVKQSNNLIFPAPPGADRILFYDFSAGGNNWLTAGAGLTITGTTLDASGVSTFLSLTDTPGSYSGQGGKVALVNIAENALEFLTVSIPLHTDLAVDTDHLKLTGSTLSFSDNEKVIAHDRQDSFLEQIDFTISEAGGTVTGSLEKETGGNLTQFWSDDFDVLDCTPAKTVNLTAFVGASDALPTASFVYILFSNKTTLVVNSSWPANSVEHIRVASIVLQTAATTGTNGALMNRNWNDPAFGITNPKGGSIVSNQRVRKEHAKWDSGVALTVTGSGTGTVTLDTTSGVVFQLNPQTFPALDMAGADDIHIVNQVVDEGGAYETSVNLVADVTHFVDGTDAGTAFGNNKYFNVVIWGIQNRDGEESHLMLNLPTGQYTLSDNAIADPSKFSVRSIPSAFTGTGFLISELTFRLTGGGSTWTLVNENSLLGDTPGIIGGSGTTTTTTVFSDAQFLIFDNGDDSKEIAFQASAIDTGTVRIITMANVNVDLADIATNTGLSHTQGTDTTLGTQAEPLNMGFFPVEDVDDYDGSVDPSANADAGTVDAHWGFEGVLTTRSGGGTLVQQAGTVDTYCDVGTNKGLQSDGTRWYQTSSYFPGTGGGLGDAARAVSLRVRVPVGIGISAFVDWGDDDITNHSRFGIWVDSDGLIQISFRGGFVKTTETIDDDEWHSILVVKTGPGTVETTLFIYLDGVLTTDNTYSSAGQTLDTGNVPLVVLGRSSAGSPNPADAGVCIDEVAIYVDGTMPGLAEAKNLYNRQKERKIEGTSLVDPRDMADPIVTLGSITAGGAANIGGALNHDGTTVGFYGVAPTVRPTAFSQEYSASSFIHTPRTAPAGAGSGADGTTYSGAECTALKVDQQNTAQVLNLLIDQLQSNGLMQ